MLGVGGSDRILRRLLPDWTRDMHAQQACAMQRRADHYAKLWDREARAAALETFGRPWEFTDYKICAIGRDEFSDARKAKLRKYAYGRSDYLSARDMHARCAGRMAMRRARKQTSTAPVQKFLNGSQDPRFSR